MNGSGIMYSNCRASGNEDAAAGKNCALAKNHRPGDKGSQPSKTR